MIKRKKTTCAYCGGKLFWNYDDLNERWDDICHCNEAGSVECLFDSYNEDEEDPYLEDEHERDKLFTDDEEEL